jgi:hypothetical protein
MASDEAALGVRGTFAPQARYMTSRAPKMTGKAIEAAVKACGQ